MSSSSASQKQQQEQPLPPAKKKPKRPKVRCVASCFRFSPTHIVWKAKGRQSQDAAHASCAGTFVFRWHVSLCSIFMYELCSFPSRSRVEGLRPEVRRSRREPRRNVCTHFILSCLESYFNTWQHGLLLFMFPFLCLVLFRLDRAKDA